MSQFIVFTQTILTNDWIFQRLLDDIYDVVKNNPVYIKVFAAHAAVQFVLVVFRLETGWRGQCLFMIAIVIGSNSLHPEHLLFLL
jgi:hypothetical protein